MLLFFLSRIREFEIFFSNNRFLILDSLRIIELTIRMDKFSNSKYIQLMKGLKNSLILDKRKLDILGYFNM